MIEFYVFFILIFIFYTVYLLLIYKSKGKFIYEMFSIWNEPIHIINYPGNDIVTISNINEQECIKLCENDNSCSGFVYIPPEDRCIFKSKLDIPVFERGHITYSKKQN